MINISTKTYYNLGATPTFILPRKTSLWCYEWVGGFEWYKYDVFNVAWRWHSKTISFEINLFMWYSFFAPEASFSLFFVAFIFFVILHPSWQFKRCLADWVEIHVIGGVTDLCGVRLLLLKLNWGLMFFVCQCRPYYLRHTTMEYRMAYHGWKIIINSINNNN